MNFFGPIVPQICQSCACGWGGFFATVQNLLKVGVGLAIFFAVVMFAYAGFLWVSTSASSENIKKGKEVLTNTLIGLVVVLGAWLVVNTVLMALGTGGLSSVTSVLGTVQPTCLQFSNPPANAGSGGLTSGAAAGSDCPGYLICSSGSCQTDPQLDNGSGAVGQQCNSATPNCQSGLVCDSTGVCNDPNATPPTIPSSCSVAVAAPSGGSCKVPSDSNNPCSVQSLSSTCFAAGGTAASQVCNLESAGGQSVIPSGSDKLNKGAGPSYSIGLWQINLTTTQIGGLNCPAAFTNPCSGQYIHNQGSIGWCDSSIKDQTLYGQCVRAAQDPQQNTQAACSLYNSKMSAWMCSASRCAVPGAKTLSGVCAPTG